MSNTTRETFSNDLRYNNEVVSMEDLSIEFPDREIQSPYYEKEDLDLIWGTLREIYDITDNRYLAMYLIYYLGFSYRKAAEVLGNKAHTSCVFYVEQAIAAVKERIKQNAEGREDS